MENEMSYEDYEKEWKRRHKALVPRKIRTSSAREYFWIAFWMLVATGAAIFSAVHTIPAAEMTIFASIPHRTELARTIFFIIELVIFGAAAGRREIDWLKYLLAGALIVALIGNIGSSVRAVTENNGDILNQVSGVFMAIIAPFTALAAGEVLHIQLDKRSDKRDAADASFNARWEEMETRCNRDYTRYAKERTQRTQYIPSTPQSEPEHTPYIPPRAVRDLADVLKQNEADLSMSAAQIRAKYGKGQTVANDAKKLALREIKDKKYTNGHDTETPVQ